MSSNHDVIEKFYSSFSNGNAKKMTDCYHEDVVFQDPAFGTLRGERAAKMWEMLLSRRTKSTKITFDNIQVSGEKGSADWTAEYSYGEKNRKVINKIHAGFKFKNGKIIKHKDTFNLWKWTQQAMGPVGYLMGWTPFMKNKIQKTTEARLDAFISSK